MVAAQSNDASVYIGSTIGWICLWAIILILPPGSKDVVSQYRLNFIHGAVCTLCGILGLLDLIDERVACMCSLGYFIVDMSNALLNDLVFKVGGYHTPVARVIEYIHHIMCLVALVSSAIYYRTLCTFDRDPVLSLMLAEASTPFLIAWRYYPNNIMGVLFAVTFFATRVVYHGLFFVPECIDKCYKPLVGSLGFVYLSLNAVFMVQIVMKIVRKWNAKNDGKALRTASEKAVEKRI